jgi:CheY-like chemotaxis protein
MPDLIKNTDIFCVEDDSDFAFLMETAIQELRKPSTVQIIDNGREALQILQKLAVEKLRPKLILLDLNLPGISGIDILKEIRAMPYLRYTAVILFSTSDRIKDIEQSLEFGANAFVTKPSRFSELIITLQSFSDFWLHQNALRN